MTPALTERRESADARPATNGSGHSLFGVDLPEGWELTTLGEVASVVGGSTPKSKEPGYWGGSVPWLAVSDLTGYREKYISGGARTITKAGFDSCSTQMLPAGSVVFSSRAPIGYLAIASRPLCTSQGFKSFVPGPSIASDYLYWYLHAARPLARALASGTTFSEISTRGAKQIPVPLPPLEEQLRIVEAIEQRLAGIEGAKGSLASAAKAVTAFRASALRRGQGQPAAGSSAAAKERPLLELVEVLDRHRVPVNRKERDLRPGDVPYYGATGQVGWIDGHLFDEELVLLGEDGVQFLDPLAQKAYIVSGKSWVNNHAHVLRPDRERVDSTYLCATLNGLDYRDLVGGTTRLKLTQKQMERLSIPLPSLAEQRQMVGAIETCMEAAEQADLSIEACEKRAEALSRAVLHRAFSGRLVAAGES